MHEVVNDRNSPAGVESNNRDEGLFFTAFSLIELDSLTAETHKDITDLLLDLVLKTETVRRCPY